MKIQNHNFNLFFELRDGQTDKPKQDKLGIISEQ